MLGKVTEDIHLTIFQILTEEQVLLLFWGKCKRNTDYNAR